MKNVNFLLVVAGLFIAGVMIYLMLSGVSLKERKMVKWSMVASADLAGKKMAQFMFPILNEYEEVVIVGSDSFSKLFYEGFWAQAKINKNSSLIKMAELLQNQEAFVINIRQIQPLKMLDGCKSGNRIDCVGVKAHKTFGKKKRDLNQFWINMFRFGKKEATLYYTAPNQKVMN